jgi:hypothetical protein
MAAVLAGARLVVAAVAPTTWPSSGANCVSRSDGRDVEGVIEAGFEALGSLTLVSSPAAFWKASNGSPGATVAHPANIERATAAHVESLIAFSGRILHGEWEVQADFSVASIRPENARVADMRLAEHGIRSAEIR